MSVVRDEAVEAFLLALPKVENHLHLDGALSPLTVQRLAERVDGSPLKGLSLDEIKRRVVVSKPREALAEVLAAFDAFYPLLKSAPAVELAAYEAAREAQRQGIMYHELRFAPVLQETENFSAREVLKAVLRGAEHGRKDFGVDFGLIICLLRPFSVISREKNELMCALAIDFAGRGVVGLDVADVGAGDEALSSYSKWLGAGRAAGLGLTAHAGEAPRGRELEDALELGVNRIGHGVQFRNRPELVAEAKRQGVTIEANLTSNVLTGAVKSYKDHPVRAWFDADVKVSLSTDDPGVFGIDLVHEYRLLWKELAFAPRELVKVARAGVDSLSCRRRARRRCSRSSTGARRAPWRRSSYSASSSGAGKASSSLSVGSGGGASPGTIKVAVLMP
ncbi:MAG: adenosine deaminase [Elusimicrobiota bacterium]|nr:MAG: adenosine deaminase [Elusimicrobiota bacterium]